MGVQTVMFVGDSLTFAYFATIEAAGFRSLVVAEWPRPDAARMVHASVAHAKVTKVSGIAEIPADLDVTVVELGTNDVLRTRPGVMRRQYGDLLGRILETSSEVEVICLGVWKPQMLARSYDRLIERECDGAGGRYAPLADLYADKRLRGPAGTPTWVGPADDFHPNDAGHRAIADRVLDLLR